MIESKIWYLCHFSTYLTINGSYDDGLIQVPFLDGHGFLNSTFYWFGDENIRFLASLFRQLHEIHPATNGFITRCLVQINIYQPTCSVLILCTVHLIRKCFLFACILERDQPEYTDIFFVFLHK